MLTIAALCICLILAVLIIFQCALIFGAPIGRFAWGGQHDVLPRRLRIGSGVSIILYVLFAVLVLDKTGILSVIQQQAVVNVGVWVLAAYFSLGILLNGISRSKPERYTMTPTVIALAALTFIVALG